MESTLLQTIRFFNSKGVNGIITRKEFLQNVSSTGQFTRDTYRMSFCRFGFLQKIGRGKYKLIKLIPETITFNNKSISYKETWFEKLFRELDEWEISKGDLK